MHRSRMDANFGFEKHQAMIDLRSDTVTRPSAEMRRAMMGAEVGDDVFGEDPTVSRLEETVAALLGKASAVFVPSGVMGNQLALKLHTQPGDEVILDAQSHIFNYESGASGVLSGVVLHPIHGDRGLLDDKQVIAALRGGHEWEARSRLVCLENTHNKAGGVLYPLDQMQAVADAARAAGLSTHLDGARLWNATAATGIPEKTYAACCDTVIVCLSKGLGAPIGSLLTGPAELMANARRFRKMFGGGMRQTGILAAAGLYALEHHREDLVDDHKKAARLAEAIASLPNFELDPSTVDTNIIMFDVTGEPAVRTLEKLASEGVLMVPFGPYTIRATTHRDVSESQIDDAIKILKRLFG